MLDTALARRRDLAPYKVLELWAQAGALPVNAMDKIERTQLSGLIQEDP